MVKVLLRFLIAIIALIAVVPASASAGTAYTTWYVDPNHYDENRRVQNLYVPDRVIGGQNVGDAPLSSPNDLFVAGNDHVYIADTGNSRIVELDEKGSFLRAIGAEDGEGQLSDPEGVFVDKDGKVYVADSGNSRVAIYSADGVFLQAFAKPKSRLLPEDYYFVPSKLVVDRRGVMYITVKGSYQGLFRMSPEGQFNGFFGYNKAELTFLDRMKRMFFSKEQLAQETAHRPAEVTNITLDHEGFFITTSTAAANLQVKKLNAGGKNLLVTYDHYEDVIMDTAVDENGFLYAVDQAEGLIIYAATGFPMYYFGRISNYSWQKGVFSFPTSIAVNSKHQIWVADSELDIVQVFSRTEFGESVLKATSLTFSGDYEESKPYWEQVVRQNDMINLSYEALGKAALNEKNYAVAKQYARIANDYKGYSKAFWHTRLEWIQTYFAVSFVILAAGIILLKLFARRLALGIKSIPWPSLLVQYSGELKDAGYTMFHPYDGFYKLKNRKISYPVMLFVLLMAGLATLAYPYLSGFTFNTIDRSRINILGTLAGFFVPWATWVIANYLVNSIKDGEGRFREVLQGSAFALLPYIVIMVPIVVISNVIVLEEKILLTALVQGMHLWMIVLFFVMTQVIHNFDFVENIRNIAITVFAVLVIWLFVFIMSGLTFNLYDFFYQLYKEVTLRG